MSTDTVITFFSLLAIFTLVLVAAMATCWVFSGSRAFVSNTFGLVGIVAAALITQTATLGSLYLSEIAHFTPCRLCWLQRAAMYPSAVALTFSVLGRRPRIGRYVIPLLAVGGLVSTYHVLLERFPQWESSVCDPNNPCTLLWVNKFGFVTIPVMALTAFVSSMFFLFLSTRKDS